jgi:mono/diheme cytochrome c family protein
VARLTRIAAPAVASGSSLLEYRAMKAALASMLVVLALMATACGGDGNGDDNGSATGTQTDSPGAQVFAEADCGNCHTLEAAGSTGTIGPNLDEARPSADEVETQVREGGGGMPSFEDRLDDQEIEDVAEFVATSAGG